MNLLSWMKPPPPRKEIQDEVVVQDGYRYWRWRIFYGMYIGYVFYYFTRKSFTFAMPAMIQSLGYTKAELGILASILSIAYGMSKFVSGVISDRCNPRYFMGIGLILTGVFNILFGLSSSITLFAIFWGLNGWFQGFGWPPCARLLTHWYSQKERGTWWGFWNTSHSVGGFLIPILVAFLSEFFGWRYALYVPGGLCIFVGIFVINRLRDTPRSLGFPSIESFRNDYPDNYSKETNKELSVYEILIEYVMKNKYIWLLSVSYFFIYVIRTAVNDWSAVFLVEEKGYTQIAAAFCVGFFEIGGIFGSLVAGWTSDKVFKGKRGPVNVLFSLGVLAAVAIFWRAPWTFPLFDATLLFAIGFLIFGPQMLIGMVAAEVSHKKAAGTATGFTGFVAYIGAATAGYPIGKITDSMGWEGYFIALGFCSLVAIILLVPLWSVKSGKRKKAR